MTDPPPSSPISGRPRERSSERRFETSAHARRSRRRRRELDAERAPPPWRFATSIEPAVAVDDPVRDREPEAGAARRRAARPPEALEDVGHVLRADAAAVVLDVERARRRRRAGPRPGPRRPRAVADRVVDEDHDELPQPGRRRPRRSPAPGRPRRGRSFAPAGLASDEAASAATSPRSSGWRSSETAPESERARSSRSSTSEVRCSTSAPMSSSASPTDADRLVGVAAEVLERAPDDGQRRAQLVARVGRELALAAEREPLVAERLADRDERPAGVDGAEPERDEDDDRAADEQHARASRRACRCSVVRSWIDLDVDAARCRCRRARSGPAAAVSSIDARAGCRGTGRRGGLDRRHRSAGHPGFGCGTGARCRRVAVFVEDHRERPRRAAAEDEPEPGSSRSGRIAARASAIRSSSCSSAAGPRASGRRSGRARRPGPRGRPACVSAAPRDEAPADAPDEPAVGGEGVASRPRRRSSVGGGAVRHRSAGSRLRGRSRSGCPTSPSFVRR